MKKIVYATNCTEHSSTALKYTYANRKIFDADLIVLHVVTSAQKLSKKETAKLLTEEKNRVADFCSSQLGDSLENLDLTISVVTGESPIKGIQDFVKDMNLQMLVIGACGAGPIRELLFGSTAKEMITHPEFPILTIPQAYEVKTPKKILYTTDFEEEDVFYLKKLVETFSTHSSKISVVHIIKKDDKPEKIKEQEEKFKKLKSANFDSSKLEYELIYSNNVVDALSKFIKEEDIDIVAMLERKNQQKSNLLHKDVVKQIYASVKVPLLIFK
ncbi:MAG: universal stress protein [Salegentibacter mishustinae]|nr:universal stress protein [Salegentibacter mishustinae]